VCLSAVDIFVVFLAFIFNRTSSGATDKFVSTLFTQIARSFSATPSANLMPCISVPLFVLAPFVFGLNFLQRHFRTKILNDKGETRNLTSSRTDYIIYVRFVGVFRSATTSKKNPFFVFSTKCRLHVTFDACRASGRHARVHTTRRRDNRLNYSVRYRTIRYVPW